jgi:hypothetical protein
MTPRDTAANNLADVLDFSLRNRPASFPRPVDPGPHPCVGGTPVPPGAATPAAMGNSEPFWTSLAQSNLAQPWKSIK